MISILARKAFCVLLMAGFGLTAQAQNNPLSNPGFDSSLLGWDEYTNVMPVWASEDANGSENSGSALLFNEGTSEGWTPLALYQCIQVEADTEYEFGGDVMVPEGQPMSAAGYIYVQPYRNADCFGPALAYLSASSRVVGQWVSTSNTIVTEFDTLSVQLSLGVFKPKDETADAEAHFDNIYFGQVIPEVEAFTVNPSMSATWFNPSEPGHGVMLNLMDATTAWMCWFTFDQQGNAVWICAMGVIDGDTITFEEAFTVEGGAFPPDFDPELITEVPWGSITITFTGCESGVMSWSTADMRFQSGEMPIARLTDLWDVPCQGD